MKELANWDFNKAPLIVIWEVTRACALACRHCRADAMTKRSPHELTFAEGVGLMDQVRELGPSVFVLTGGDPLLRPDFNHLAWYAQFIGLRVSASPSGTKLVTPDSMKRAADAGVKRVQFSLDAATAETHDRFRGVKGSFQWTMDGIRFAREAGMEIQVGTTVTRQTVGELEAVADLLRQEGCSMWNVFFLVPVGRGQADDMVSPEEAERIMNWLYDLSTTVPYAIKTTEGPFFRRVVMQRSDMKDGKMPPALTGLRGSPAPGMAMPGRIATFGVNDGRGFVFIDHMGEVYPSGFLPLSAGNIRQKRLKEMYQDSPVFRALRDPAMLRGKCGACEFKQICGGSRSRAYALTGDYLESDPLCPYIPHGYQQT